jgi:hypothetical protein
MDNIKESSTIIIFPHFLLMREYLKVAEEEKDLLNFYYKSLEFFDKLVSHTEQSFGKFINENGKSLT